MNTAYAAIKNTVNTATDDQLVSAFKLLDLNEDSTTEETLVYTALVAELETRGLVAFNGNTWTYELVA